MGSCWLSIVRSEFVVGCVNVLIEMDEMDLEVKMESSRVEDASSCARR